MAYDDVIPYHGEFGRYQFKKYILLCLPTILCAFHKLGGVFLQAKPDHRCRLPFEEQNATYNSLSSDVIKMSYPWEVHSQKWASCLRYDTNYSTQYFENGIPANKSITCTEYVYDLSKYETSAVIDWDMVCDKAYLRATGDALFMFGVLLGSIVFGDLSDRYGRKPIFFVSIILQLIFGTLAAISPEFITFSICRLIIGMTTSGEFLVAYVIIMEMVGPSKRLPAGTICQLFFSSGYILLAIIVYYVHDWRMLQIAITLPGAVFLCYWWLIPESIRWLLSKNRTDEAKQIIHNIAKENKIKLEDEVLDRLLAIENNSIKDEHKPSLLDLFKYPNLRRKTLIIFFDWFVNSAAYYGLSWNTSNLGGNDLVNFCISGLVEFPAYTFLLFTLNRWGRKPMLCGCMIVSGTVLLLTMAVPDNQPWIVVVLAMFGKLAITSSYGTIYIFTTEQYPTVIRNVGLGAASMSARIGGILAPYVNLLADYWKPFPLIIFGSLAFAGGLLSLLLPETLNKQLPESIADGENFGRKTEKGSKKEKERLKNGDVEKPAENGNANEKDVEKA